MTISRQLDKAIRALLLVPLCRCDQCKSIRNVLRAYKAAVKRGRNYPQKCKNCGKEPPCQCDRSPCGMPR